MEKELEEGMYVYLEVHKCQIESHESNDGLAVVGLSAEDAMSFVRLILEDVSSRFKHAPPEIRMELRDFESPLNKTIEYFS